MLMLAVFLFAIAAASASDVNDTIVAGEDTGQIELSASNEMAADNLKTNEENITLTQADNCEIIGADGIGTFSELQKEIDNAVNGSLNLTRDYQWDSDFTGYGIVN